MNAQREPLVHLNGVVRVDSSGEWFQTVIDRDCGHSYRGCVWNTDAAARRHGEILLKHTVCGSCGANRRRA